MTAINYMESLCEPARYRVAEGIGILTTYDENGQKCGETETLEFRQAVDQFRTWHRWSKHA